MGITCLHNGWGRVNWCTKISSCEDDMLECPTCVSGERECHIPESLKCWVPGKCNGEMIGFEKTCSQKDCLGACQHNSACNYFNYDAKTQLCKLLFSCDDDMIECHTCVSGEDQRSVNYLAHSFETYDLCEPNIERWQ